MPYLRCENCNLKLYRATGRFARETCPACHSKLPRAPGDVHDWLAHTMLTESDPRGRTAGKQSPPWRAP